MHSWTPPFPQIEKLEQMLPMSEDGGAAAAAEGTSDKDEAAMAARAQEQQVVSRLHMCLLLVCNHTMLTVLLSGRQ